MGSITIQNQRGNIRADTDADVELIRTNRIDLDSDTASIGQQASGLVARNPISVELVRFRERNGAVIEIAATADARIDTVLDLTAFDRADAVLGGAFSITVPISRLSAGDDVDIVVNDSKEGNGLSTVADMVVSLFNPPASTAFFTAIYRSHFRPDITDVGMESIRRAFGTDSVEIDSTYNFALVRAGDDIDIGHISTTATFGEPRSYRTTQIGGAPYGSSVVVASPPDRRVNFIIVTDADWSGGTSEPDGIEQIFLTTNGDIIATEFAGDMFLGRVHSTLGNVSLTSNQRILDADRQVSVDVTGSNIRLTSGDAGKRQPGPRGGVGQANDFLEVNTDRNNTGGRLDAFAISATINDGIFVDELTATMPVDLIQSRANVALRTVNGSIIDFDNDASADVVGLSIDIDANGVRSSIGQEQNDLEINSGAGVATPGLDSAGHDVALEAPLNI